MGNLRCSIHMYSVTPRLEHNKLHTQTRNTFHFHFIDIRIQLKRSLVVLSQISILMLFMSITQKLCSVYEHELESYSAGYKSKSSIIS